MLKIIEQKSVSDIIKLKNQVTSGDWVSKSMGHWVIQVNILTQFQP